MKKLLFSYYVKFNSSNIDFIMLLLIHELRIVSTNQLTQLVSQEIPISYKTISRRLNKMKREELIDFITDYDNSQRKYYYLTRSGYNSIGGFYSFPKVPEYNLNHHLIVTNYLIRTLHMIKEQPHFMHAKTERRQTYEKKDFQQTKKGRFYHVADYVIDFEAENKTTIEWHFEIELSMKSKNRYLNGIFPKYLAILSRKKNAHVLYVTPKKSIKRELENFKIYFKAQKKQGKFPELEAECFNRLHVIPSEEFDNTLSYLLENDSYINW